MLSLIDYLTLGGILAFLQGLIVAYSSEKLGRRIACIICVYMVTFIFAYPGWIDYANSIGIFNYSTLSPLFPVKGAYLDFTIFTTRIEIPIYLAYSLALASSSVIGLTLPLLEGTLLLIILALISAVSITTGILINTLSAISFLQLELFGASCLIFEVFTWWSQRTSRIIADKAKRYYEFIKARRETTAEDIMRSFHVTNEREFSRVIQKLLDEHKIIASERNGKIVFSVNSTEEP
ncbi:MAG: hypothetical protein ABIM44_04095 [candidate division WOR-3 bacterium]